MPISQLLTSPRSIRPPTRDSPPQLRRSPAAVPRAADPPNSQRSPPAVVDRESIYRLVAGQALSVTAGADRRREAYRQQQLRDEEGLGTASGLGLGLDAHQLGIAPGSSSGMTYAARRDGAFVSGRSRAPESASPSRALSPLSPAQQLPPQRVDSGPPMRVSSYTGVGMGPLAGIGEGPGGGAAPVSYKKHYFGGAASPADAYDAGGVDASAAAPIAALSHLGAALIPTGARAGAPVSAADARAEARAAYARDLELQAAEQRRRREAERSYRFAPGWAATTSALPVPAEDRVSGSSSYSPPSPRRFGGRGSPALAPIAVAETPSSSRRAYDESLGMSASPSSRPHLLDPISASQETAPSPTYHSYSPKWMSAEAARLQSEIAPSSATRDSDGGGGVAAEVAAELSDASPRLRAQLARLTRKFEDSLDLLQTYADRYGPL